MRANGLNDGADERCARALNYDLEDGLWVGEIGWLMWYTKCVLFDDLDARSGLA